METFLLLAFALSLVGPICRVQAQGNPIVYVGESMHGKLFFTFKYSYNWLESFNVCSSRGMFSATIDDYHENLIIQSFLSYSDEIPLSSSFWLPATDFASESQFAWIKTKEPLFYSNWAPGFPSVNRTRNCVVIRADGKWHEEVCSVESDVEKHYPLCQVPMLDKTDPQKGIFDNNRKEQGFSSSREQALTASVPRTAEGYANAKIVPIGGVGTKLYFRDETDTKRNLGTALNFCHALGMRFVSPETDAERDFLRGYSMELYMNGQDPYFLSSLTDLLSTTCTRSNAEFRSFYSHLVIDDPGLDHHAYRYKCLLITPGDYGAPDCTWSTWTVCELGTGK